MSVERSESELGAFYRRKRAQKSPASAATATAHKIARLYYSLVKHGSEYEEQGARAYEEREQERTVAVLRKRAKALGYELVGQAAKRCGQFALVTKTERQRLCGRRQDGCVWFSPSAGVVS